MYFYVKALHIIFVVTWFSGLFYIVRLFVYSAEANTKEEPERTILINQFSLMRKRLWYGITWPSAVLTVFFGTWMAILYGGLPTWLLIKLFLVGGLLFYHFSLQRIFLQQQKEIFSWSSQQLRMWNEVATIFLICIVMLVVVKQLLSVFWAIIALLLLGVALFLSMKLYKKYRR